MSCGLHFQGVKGRREVGVSMVTDISEDSIERIIRAMRKPTKKTATADTGNIRQENSSSVAAPITQVLQSDLDCPSAKKTIFVSPEICRKVGYRKRLCDHSEQSKGRIVKQHKILIEERMGITGEDTKT